MPLLRFLLLGGALFLARAPAEHLLGLDREPLRVPEAQLQQLRDEWLRSNGRPPTPAELSASVQQWLGDEVLFREALRLRLDEGDVVVRERLLRNMRFAFPERADGDDGLRRAARALGMVEQDPVIRRRLVQKMEQRLLADLRVDEAALREYVAAHPDRYARPARYVIQQVFVGRERDADGGARAAQLLARLRSGDASAVRAGDGFALASDGARSHAELARLLGLGVADSVAMAAPGEWIGPVASAYGWHLLRVTETIPAAAADFERVRGPAALALQAEARDAHLRAERLRLAAHYRLELPS